MIVEQSLLDNMVGNLKKQIVETIGRSVPVYLLASKDIQFPQEYFAKGVEGIFESYLDARTMMMAVRKTLLPQHLQWQVTSHLEPSERISFIADNLTDLKNYNCIQFGSGGFCLRFASLLQLGDRVEYTFYFSECNQAYIVQGMAVVRWFDQQSFWGGVEFESMHGQGGSLFIQWLQKQGFVEFIPTAA